MCLSTYRSVETHLSCRVKYVRTAEIPRGKHFIINRDHTFQSPVFVVQVFRLFQVRNENGDALNSPSETYIWKSSDRILSKHPEYLES
jgi:hypothetical protein